MVKMILLCSDIEMSSHGKKSKFMDGFCADRRELESLWAKAMSMTDWAPQTLSVKVAHIADLPGKLKSGRIWPRTMANAKRHLETFIEAKGK